jgi:LysR family transcriptional regulator, positive regulator for ilvC
MLYLQQSDAHHATISMDTKPLKQFLTLAETLHFGRASHTLNISTSALSRSIHQLEEHVGVPLFHRDSRSVSLTWAGIQFQDFARETLHQWDTLRSNLQEHAGQLQGELSLYCSVTASYSFLYDILSNFRRQWPGIEIKLRTGDPDHAINRVLSADEDIAIAARPTPLPRQLAFRLITVSPLLFIAPRNEPSLASLLAGPDKATNWAEIPMILSESGVSRQRVDQWFRARSITPRIYAQVAGNEAIVSMVSLGFGVGVVPRIVLDNSPLAERVMVLPVSPELSPYEVGLFARHRSLSDPVIRAFWTQPGQGEDPGQPV